MTSVLSSYGQLPTQSKYFIAVAANTNGNVTTAPSDPTIAAFTLGGLLGPTALAPGDITTDTIITGTPGYLTQSITAGTLFRDLGRKFIIAVPTVLGAVPSTYVAIYRQMQVVSGPSTEGNPGPNGLGTYPTVYVKVWQAADSEPDGSVCVARTG